MADEGQNYAKSIRTFSKSTADYTYEDFRQRFKGLCMEKGGRAYVAALENVNEFTGAEKEQLYAEAQQKIYGLMVRCTAGDAADHLKLKCHDLDSMTGSVAFAAMQEEYGVNTQVQKEHQHCEFMQPTQQKKESTKQYLAKLSDIAR